MKTQNIMLVVVVVSLVGMFIAIGAFMTLAENLAKALQVLQ